MAGVAASGNPACGHPVQPGFLFCPVCGQLAAGRAAPSEPSTAPLPVVPALPQSALSAPVAPAAAPRSQPESTPWDSWYAPRRSPSPSPSPSTGPQPWPMPPGSVLPTPADPDATRVDGPDLLPYDSPDLLPYDDPAAAMLDDLRQAPASGGPRPPRRPLVPVIVA